MSDHRQDRQDPKAGWLTRALFRALLVAVTQIQRDLTRLEDQVSENQDKLDADVAAINEAVGNVVTEVAALKDAVANGTPLDFTGLDAAVAGLNASTDVVESTEVVAPPAE